MLNVNVPCTLVHTPFVNAAVIPRVENAPLLLAQSVSFVDIVTVGPVLSVVASSTYALTWYVAPATMPLTPTRFTAGPM